VPFGGPLSFIIVLILGVLFFGKDLPGVAKRIGSSMLEFRKGLDEWKELRVDCEDGGQERESGGLKSPDLDGESTEDFESLGVKFEPPLSSEGV
jgi:Sec-independent protein translocase protein TatA